MRWSPFAEVASDESLFRVIPIIVENDYAIVRGGDKTILGIITTSDLSLQFRQLSEPFLLLGEIENHMRGIISARFSISEMRTVKDSGDADRDVNSVSDLTFGEYQRLLEAPANWQKLGVFLDRVVFTKLLEKVRTIRNDVMHFDPDGIDDSDLVALRDFVRFLRALKSLEVT